MSKPFPSGENIPIFHSHWMKKSLPLISNVMFDNNQHIQNPNPYTGASIIAVTQQDCNAYEI